jgi:hypothetical protein
MVGMAEPADGEPTISDPEFRRPVAYVDSGDTAALATLLRALNALIDGGANIDAPGRVLGGGTPLGEAVVFRHFPAAERLLDAGAAFDLAIAAGVGRRDLVDSFFDNAGGYCSPHPPMPPCGEPADPGREVDQAFHPRRPRRTPALRWP